ncbi:MAG: hypothetical protein ACQER9_01855 [Nanobdellota archaeon]
MTLTPPKSMKEVYYHTLRKFPEGGKVRAWAYRKLCPECEKGYLGKPVNNKTGKVKIRSKEMVCDNCGYETSKEEAEEGVQLEAIYTCPSCGKEGESKAPYKRKTYHGVPAYIVVCEHCGYKIALTKKLKEPKKKK